MSSERRATSSKDFLCEAPSGPLPKKDPPASHFPLFDIQLHFSFLSEKSHLFFECVKMTEGDGNRQTMLKYDTMQNFKKRRCACVQTYDALLAKIKIKCDGIGNFRRLEFIIFL